MEEEQPKEYKIMLQDIKRFFQECGVTLNQDMQMVIEVGEA